MSTFSGKRPSAGVILGTLAVVLAITVPALAGSTFSGKITKGKVRTIARNQVHQLAPDLSVKSADTANTANSAKIATNVFSAMVRADGNLLGSIPSGASSTHVGGPGGYNVLFNKDLTGCTLSASLADATSNPPEGEVTVGVVNSSTLRVFTRNETGAIADRPFFVQAICPSG